jgi:hypothetical protein
MIYFTVFPPKINIVAVAYSVKTGSLSVKRDTMRLMISFLLSLLYQLIYGHSCESYGKITICEGEFIELESKYCGKRITMVDDINYLDLRKCAGKKSTINFLIRCPIIILSNCDVVNVFMPEYCEVSDNMISFLF